MNTTAIKFVTILWLIFFLLFGLFACGSTNGGVRFFSGKGTGKNPSSQVKKGPPAHAPAHGNRAKYQYHYYPSCSIYFDVSRNLYFYLSGENWKLSAELPSKLKVNLGDHVSLELETDRPYTKHKEHKKKYPPGQKKKK